MRKEEFYDKTKNWLRNVGLLIIPAFLTPTITSAATIAKFVIEAPATVTVNEAFDVTVKAVDSSGQVVPDYRGSIVFSTDWIADTVPMPGKSIAFTEDDAGVKKFSKGVIFKRKGTNKLYVTTLKDEAVGEVSILVEEGSVSTTTETEEVNIITPANDTKITGSVITVSGKSRKNSKILLSLNGKDIGTVTSDDTGLFTKEITDISQENNILKASLLDASDNTLGTSPEVRFIRSNESSSIYGLVISPNNSVEPSTDITLTVDAIKGLAEVTILLDNSLLTAKETAEGKYSLTTKAPLKEGTYPITVTAKTVTNQETKKENITTLTVLPKQLEAPVESKKPTFKNIKAETQDQKITFSFEVENPPTNLATFRITYGATGAVVTQHVEKILKNSIYTWYIDNLLPGEHTFKIQGQKADAGLIEDLISEPITATIGVKSCTISNVGKISVKTDTSKSILTWDSVKDAAAYNIYQIDAQGKYSLIAKTTEPKYTIYLSQGVIEYKDFAIKAVCGENTESADYSSVSKVQTGPGMIAFFVVISGIFGAILLRRRNA